MRLNLVSRLVYLNVFCGRKGLVFITLLIERIIFLLSSARISSKIEIGKNVRFAYNAMSCLIVKNTVIGDNCLIGARVTTARKFPFKDVPKIGNNVFVGFNASIIGPVTIANNAVIAPHSLVNTDIGDGEIFAGCPAKRIGHRDDLEYDLMQNEKYE
jgi:serine O-acetyltransferase